jgi:hypothetical protein
MATFKDFNGKELMVGDKVVFIAPGYRMLAVGHIISFTNQKVRIAYQNTWNYASGYSSELLQTADQLVKS